MIESILSFVVGGLSAIHFVCVANFLPRVGPTLKIRVSVLACAMSSAALMVCPLYPEHIQDCTWMLLGSFLLYELAKWKDGVLICEHYSR